MNTIANSRLPDTVQQPAYDRTALKSRIVHIGFGAFHRAHQALLTDRVLNKQGGDWGICEVSLFGADVLIQTCANKTTSSPYWKKARKAIKPLSLARYVNRCMLA